MNNQSDPPNSSLTGCTSIAEMAGRESCQPDAYTAALVNRIGATDLTFAQQASRLRILAGIATGASPDEITAEELARHYALTYALFERFSVLAADCATNGKSRGAALYMNAAASAQRASLAVLNAMESLRQRATQPTAFPLSG